mgnify:FL=1
MVVTRNGWIKFHSPADGEGNDLGGGDTSFVADTPATDSADSSTDEDVNWGGMADELIADDSAVEGDEVVVETPETPVVETPAATPPPADNSVDTPATVTTPAPSAPAVAPPAVPTATTEEYSVWRENRLTQLEQMYAVDEESATALLTEPELVLPKLAAKVHMEVMENSMRAMQAMVPVMMHQVQQHAELNTRAKSLFHGTNPDLVDPSYEPMIMEMGQSFRRVNPNASPEQASKAIGNLVRAALGIAAPQVQQPGIPPQVQQRQPAVVPFSPARGAGGGNAPVRPSNPFEAMAEEMRNEDW